MKKGKKKLSYKENVKVCVCGKKFERYQRTADTHKIGTLIVKEDR